MKILVTGGAGYLGSVVTSALLLKGHTVRCLERDKVRASRLAQLNAKTTEGCEVLVGDIRSQEDVVNAMHGIDAVFHLAAVVGYPSCDAEPEAARSINVHGTSVLAHWTPPDVPFVLLSTCSVYGRTIEGICRESDQAQPLTLYGRTKLDAERVVLDMGGVVLRASTAYGPSPQFRMDLIVHSFINDALLKQQLSVFEPGAIRPFIHVNDVAEALTFAQTHYALMRGNRYNIGSNDATLTKLDLATKIAALVDAKIAIDESGSDPDGRQYRIAFDQIERLGFRAARSFDAGLKATIDHMRDMIERNILDGVSD